MTLVRALFALFALAVALAGDGTVAAARQTPSGAADAPHAQVDRIFARWAEPGTPGCSVGVSSGGTTVLEKAYGLANLEHAVPNTPATIFEAGSVSKQFTAAAILLLAREGKLALDDPARRYVPELPDYGSPITLTQLLQHTSGLRDWGEVAAIAGWPRGSRVHTHAHVLDIVRRQRALNFAPGTDWSYSNTGYNLAAIIVSRASGQSFADYTRARIFEPLGMRSTAWRDDYTRVVRNRAVAYSGGSDGFRTNMPFENVHGNGGLLTTVGDLLRWNGNFDSPIVGDRAFASAQLEPGVFRDGRPHDYAYGLYVGSYKGVREIAHGGATAGYRAYLARYPDQHLSVAVLCNAASAEAARYAREVAEVYLHPHLRTEAPAAAYTMERARLQSVAGLYRHAVTGATLRLVHDGSRVSAQPWGTLLPVAAGRFVTAAGGTIEVDGGGGRIRIAHANGTRALYERVEPVTPTAAQLADYAGVFTSDEAEVTLTVAVESGGLVLRRRPDATLALTPLDADAFRSPEGLVRFHRGSANRVIELSLVSGRVWDMRFRRSSGTGTD